MVVVRKCFKKRAYVALVRTLLEYCSPVQNPHLKKDCDKLESMQKQAAHTASGTATHIPGHIHMKRHANISNFKTLETWHFVHAVSILCLHDDILCMHDDILCMHVGILQMHADIGHIVHT